MLGELRFSEKKYWSDGEVRSKGDKNLQKEMLFHLLKEIGIFCIEKYTPEN